MSLDYVSRRALGPLLNALERLEGSKPTKSMIHEEANTYKNAATTLQALAKLVKLDVLRRRNPKDRDAYYVFSAKGKSLLAVPEEKRFAVMYRWYAGDEPVRRCTICDSVIEPLIYFKQEFWCDACLNVDTPLQLEAYQTAESVFERW